MVVVGSWLLVVPCFFGGRAKYSIAVGCGLQSSFSLEGELLEYGMELV